MSYEIACKRLDVHPPTAHETALYDECVRLQTRVRDLEAAVEGWKQRIDRDAETIEELLQQHKRVEADRDFWHQQLIAARAALASPQREGAGEGGK